MTAAHAKGLGRYRRIEGEVAHSLEGLVLGTAGLGGLWGSINPSASVDAILYALEQGLTALDTAPAYSRAESLVGQALRQWTGQRPTISTKVGRLRSDQPDVAHYDYTPESIRQSAYRSLETLGVDYLDLLLLHDPEAIPAAMIPEAIATLVKLREEGVTRSLGVGGNFPAHFRPYLTADVFRVSMGFNRLNAVCRVALAHELPFLQSRSIAFWQASPLYMGLLSDKLDTLLKSPPAWIDPTHLEAAQQIRTYADPLGLTLPEVALRYLRSVVGPEKIVIGAANRAEIQNSLKSWKKGSLPEPIFSTLQQMNL